MDSTPTPPFIIHFINSLSLNQILDLYKRKKFDLLRFDSILLTISPRFYKYRVFLNYVITFEF